MLPAKYQPYPPGGSGEENFLIQFIFLIIYFIYCK